MLQNLINRILRLPAYLWIGLAFQCLIPLNQLIVISPFTFNSRLLGLSFLAQNYTPIIAFLGVCYAFGLLILSLFGFFRKGKDARKLLICSILIGAASVLSIFVEEDVRNFGFYLLAMRSKPLISAISQFERDRHRPPAALDELVPQYLKKVPGTGMAVYPNYEYEVSPSCPDDCKTAWELRVPCSSGILNWDVFIYWPGKNYPRYGWGGCVERIGDWAYVNE